MLKMEIDNTRSLSPQIKQHLIQPWDEQEFYPLALYKGSQSLGRLKALYNMLCVGMESDEGSVSGLSKASTDGQYSIASVVGHASGLHAIQTPTASFNSMIMRLAANPAAMERTPGMAQYVADLIQFHPRPWTLYRLDPIPALAEKSWRPWRIAKPLNREPNRHISESWPYIEFARNDDDQMLLNIDAAVPDTLPSALRADICQDIVVAVLEGVVALDVIGESVTPYLKANFKKYPVRYGPYSLNTTASWTSEDDARDGEVVAARLRLRDAPEPSNPIEALMHEEWS